jgi:hypothetical protein
VEQVIDLVELEEKYGADIVGRLRDHIDHCVNENLKYKIDVNTQDYRNFTYITFATRAYAYSYEISNKRKNIVGENRVGFFEVEKIQWLMNSLN